MNIFQRLLKPAEPKLFQPYHQKERDPLDMIAYVVPFDLEDGIVYYTKYYKDRGIRNQSEECSLREFNYWFREGR